MIAKMSRKKSDKQKVWEALSKPIRRNLFDGWPMGEVTILMSSRGSGKTLFYQQWQKQLQKIYPNSTVYIDLECSYCKDEKDGI